MPRGICGSSSSWFRSVSSAPVIASQMFSRRFSKLHLLELRREARQRRGRLTQRVDSLHHIFMFQRALAGALQDVLAIVEPGKTLQHQEAPAFQDDGDRAQRQVRAAGLGNHDGLAGEVAVHSALPEDLRFG